ncbi:MAG: hypothetical protein KC621_01075 [Myxococcales bacterium]|nr:hypothetical protein [Myxococcales bacterium]
MRRVPLVLLWSVAGCFLRPAQPITDAFPRCAARLPKKSAGTGDMSAKWVKGTNAHCNDGSPPVMYLRESSNPAHRDDWVVFLEGGGSCASNATCQDRWCGVGHFNANKMSSKFSPDREDGGGMMSSSSDNPFHDWNVVEMKYCSSDIWLGNGKSQQTLSGLRGSFMLYFQGHAIIEALLDELDGGTTSDDGRVNMPRLTNAKNIVLAGASAGGRGTLQHVDWLTNRYSNARVVGVMDGWNSPELSAWSDADRSVARSAEQTQWEQTYQGTWQAWTDKDCKGAACVNAFEVMNTAVSAPLLVRHDMYDPGTSDTYTNQNIPLNRFAQAMAKTARSESKLRPDISIVETACGTHIVAQGDTFTKVAVQDADKGGQYWTMAEAAAAFVDGQKVVAIDDPSRDHSKCAGAGAGQQDADKPAGRRR